MDSISSYIYEIQKGTKPMALVTIALCDKEEAIKKIQKSGLSYVIQENGKKINIFFGHPPCVSIVEGFLHKQLFELSAQEDFMLGIMLGYCRKAQCERYLSRTSAPERLAV